MTNEEVRQWLDAEWNDALNSGAAGSDPEIDELTDSGVKSIRYALVTQMLGKIADPERSLMALQLGKSDEGAWDARSGAWDARSFATAVVVPWERDNQQVIGASPDPYVSKPLRRLRLDDGTSVRSKIEWNRLIAFFVPLDTAPSEELHRAFRRVLQSLVRRLARQSFSYPIPHRISQHHLERLVLKFMSQPSGGLRPLAVSAALFKTLGEGFSLFSDVRSQGINEADAASGMPGDIMCHDQAGRVCLAVEVKDVNLTLAHVKEASRKARQSSDGPSSFMLAVPDIQQNGSMDFDEVIRSNWASGLNLYTVAIPTLIGTTFMLLEEGWRVRFLREVGQELDRRQDQKARQAWYDLLNQEEHGSP